MKRRQIHLVGTVELAFKYRRNLYDLPDVSWSREQTSVVSIP